MKTHLFFAPKITLSADKKIPTKFSGVAYSGGVIPNYGWNGDAAIDLNSFSMPTAPIFALLDHNHEKRVGKLSARIVDNQVHIDGEFFNSTDAGREVSSLFAEGAPWQLSVGINAKQQNFGDGKDMTVNGKQLKIQTLFTNASLREVSFVPVGADPATAVTAFSKLNEESEMTIEELQAQIKTLQANLDNEKARADKAEADMKSVRLAARKASMTQLSADIGRDLSKDESAALEGMNDEVYVVMASTLLSLKPKAPEAPEHLFKEQAINGKKQDDAQPTMADSHRAIFAQVAGLKI